MSESLDTKIFEAFVDVVNKKQLLTGRNIDELKSFIGKAKVSAEDWELIIDKECFPSSKDKKDAE